MKKMVSLTLPQKNLINEIIFEYLHYPEILKIKGESWKHYKLPKISEKITNNELALDVVKKINKTFKKIYDPSYRYCSICEKNIFSMTIKESLLDRQICLNGHKLSKKRSFKDEEKILCWFDPDYPNPEKNELKNEIFFNDDEISFIEKLLSASWISKYCKQVKVSKNKIGTLKTKFNNSNKKT